MAEFLKSHEEVLIFFRHLLFLASWLSSHFLLSLFPPNFIAFFLVLFRPPFSNPPSQVKKKQQQSVDNLAGAFAKIGAQISA
jgi:hypothetical protein